MKGMQDGAPLCTPMEGHLAISRKSHTHLLIDLAIPVLGIYPQTQWQKHKIMGAQVFAT